MVFLPLVLNYIPTNANVNEIHLDESLKPSQTTTWLEPSLIAKDEISGNFTRIVTTSETLFAINHPSELVLFEIFFPYNLSMILRENTYKYQDLVFDQNYLYLTCSEFWVRRDGLKCKIVIL